MEDVGRWACGRPELGGGMQNADSDADDDVFSEELSLERLHEPGARTEMRDVQAILIRAVLSQRP